MLLKLNISMLKIGNENFMIVSKKLTELRVLNVALEGNQRNITEQFTLLKNKYIKLMTDIENLVRQYNVPKSIKVFK